MADVFISYKRQDHARAAMLAAALEANGYTVWWDANLQAGENWARRIKAELDAAKCSLVLWTDASIGPDSAYVSDNVEAEANEAARRKVLLPVQMNADRVAWTHQHLHYTRLADWDGGEDHQELVSLMRTVQSYAGARTKPATDELTAWTQAQAADTVEALSAFTRDFAESRFKLVAVVRLMLAKSREHQLKLRALMDSPDHAAWLSESGQVLAVVNSVIAERLEELEQECGDVGTEDGPNPERLEELDEELGKLLEAAEIADEIRDTRRQLEELQGEVQQALFASQEWPVEVEGDE